MNSTRNIFKALILICLLFIAGCFTTSMRQDIKAIPQTRMDNIKEQVHGIEIIDPYRWLEDGQSEETRQWIEAQNNYSQPLIGNRPDRTRLKKRITELLKVDWQSLPQERNGRYFIRKRSGDQEMAVLYMREGLDGKDVMLVDPNPMSSDNTTSTRLQGVSEDGSLMAYSIRQGGQDEQSIHFLNVDTKENLPEVLPTARYMSFSLKPDKSGCYYTRHEANGPRIYYHKMGTEPASDIKIFGDGYDADKIAYTELSEDGRHLLITVRHGSAGMKMELYYQDMVKNTPIVPIVNDIDAKFYGEIVDEKFFLQTDWNAPNGRIISFDINNPDRKYWKEIVRQNDAVIDYFKLAGGKLFINYTKNASSTLSVFEADGRYIKDIQFPAIGSIGDFVGRWKNNEAFFSFSTYHIPSKTYIYNTKTDTKKIWWEADISVQSDTYDVKQVWFKSKDGTKVPMFIVHAKGVKLNGKNPTLLTAYGGFGHKETPYFSVMATLWMEAGGVYVMPNIRGGGEFGENWHKAGMLENKQNSFDDFIAAAQWLIDEKYTSSDKIVIVGGSNGGLLVGAAITQRPDMFRAAVCLYPLLDMVRYHKFLVAKFWASEYGCAEDPQQFKYLYAYSPYHHVKKGVKYPAVLFVTGDRDTRVDPLHARKMTALLQSVATADRPVLLQYYTKAGHVGGHPMSRKIEEVADDFGFMLWQLGMSFP
ncbi:MAG: S9 family peptidase [Sedimentisphaerales bacterium]|nr:S9 family peptidase [Sedimentisphaerales bacterium]